MCRRHWRFIVRTWGLNEADTSWPQSLIMMPLKRLMLFLVGLLLILSSGTLLAMAPYRGWLGMRTSAGPVGPGPFEIPFWAVVLMVAIFLVGLVAALCWRRKRLFTSIVAGVVGIAAAAVWGTTYSGALTLEGGYDWASPPRVMEIRYYWIYVNFCGMMVDYEPRHAQLKPGRDPAYPNPQCNCGYWPDPSAASYPVLPTVYKPSIVTWNRWGFGYCRYWGTRVGKGYPWTAVVLPLWFVTLLSAVVASWWPVYWWRQRGQFGPEHCQECGYDLRASKARCPECGTPVPSIPRNA